MKRTWSRVLITVLSLTPLFFGGLPANATDYCWADAATGKRVRTRPKALTPSDILSSSDPHHYTNSTTGQNFVDQPDGSWIDSQTGQAVETVPYEVEVNDILAQSDPNHYTNSKTGKTYFRVPCPPPEAAQATSPEKEKPKEQPEKVEEKKEPSWWERLIPALIPSIGIGGGRERERREPSNPCAPRR